MGTAKPTKRTCENGHVYYKSSECPICPLCEDQRKPDEGFLSEIAAPARRALEDNKINTLEKLATFSEKEILSFHGMGKSGLIKLKTLLNKKGLHFKD